MPKSMASRATEAAATAVRLRRIQRRARTENGSAQAEVGSSAAHRSTSSARARAARVAVLGLRRHRLQADGLQRRVDRGVELAGRREVALLDLAEDLADVALERGLAGQQAIERGAEAVDVGARPEVVEVARGLLGAHVGRRAQRRAGQRLGTCRWPTRASASARRRGRDRLDLPQRLGQAPVDHQRLAVLADDHVARLDVAVQDAPAVGVVDRVADVDEPPQELAQLQRAGTGIGVAEPGRVEASIASLRLSPRMNRIA